jgi:hypothetical protein
MCEAHDDFIKEENMHMKLLVLIIGTLAGFGTAHAASATWRDADGAIHVEEGNASDFPGADVAPPQSPSPRAASDDEYGDYDRIIHDKCAQDWPTDYEMRAYCEKQQRDGLRNLRRNNPVTPNNQ